MGLPQKTGFFLKRAAKRRVSVVTSNNGVCRLGAKVREKYWALLPTQQGHFSVGSVRGPGLGFRFWLFLGPRTALTLYFFQNVLDATKKIAQLCAIHGWNPRQILYRYGQSEKL